MINKINLTKISFALSLIFFISGTVYSIPVGTEGARFYLLDLASMMNFGLCVFSGKRLIALFRKDRNFQYFSLFIAVCIVSLIFSPVFLSGREKMISFLYTARLVFYFSYYLLLKMADENILRFCRKSLFTAGIIFIFSGWIQYLLFPNLRVWEQFGWDPHDRRIFGTLLDPNYSGIIFLLIMIYLLSNVTSGWKKITLGILSFGTILFTYSRSTYLSLLSILLNFSYFYKSRFILLAGFLALIFTIIIIPKPAGESANLARWFTVTARIENWREGMGIFLNNPTFGVGFNTLRYYRNTDSAWNFYRHSLGGIDNSFIYVSAVSGITGLFFYVIFLKRFFSKKSILIKSTLIAVLIHSFFQNTLFYPWVMFWIFIVGGL